MSMETPWNDVPDQLRAVDQDNDAGAVDEEASVGRPLPEPGLPEVPEADPADVADQQRVVPLPEDGPVPDGGW